MTDLSQLDEHSQQRWEWQKRIIEAVLDRKFDDETIVIMLIQGFHQAHQEGISEAAQICEEVAAVAPIGEYKRVATTLGESLRELVRRNEESAARG